MSFWVGMLGKSLGERLGKRLGEWPGERLDEIFRVRSFIKQQPGKDILWSLGDLLICYCLHIVAL